MPYSPSGQAREEVKKDPQDKAPDLAVFIPARLTWDGLASNIDHPKGNYY